MDFRLLSVLCLLLTALLAAGCQSGADLAPLERENRLLEDRIYQLEDELDRHCDLVDNYEREIDRTPPSQRRPTDYGTSPGKTARMKLASTTKRFSPKKSCNCSSVAHALTVSTNTVSMTPNRRP